MAIHRTALFVLSLLLLPASHIHGLEVTPHSPCKSKCASGNAATTENSIVCLDSDYNSTSSGVQFQQCVECELGSKAADPITGTTDVMWGLCKSICANSSLRTSLTLSRQSAIYTLCLHVWLPNPDGLLEQPMPGNLRTTFHRDRKWTQSQRDNGRLVLLQCSQLFDYNHSAVRVLLWVDGSAEIPGQLYTHPYLHPHKNFLLIRRTSSPPSPRRCLSRPTLSYQPLSSRCFVHLQFNHNSTAYNLFAKHVRVTSPSWRVIGPRHCPSYYLRLLPRGLYVRRLLLLCAPTT